MVDNSSDAACAAAVANLCRERRWDLIASPRNIGFGAAVNLGVLAAFRHGCGPILLVNPDASLDETTAQQLVELSRADTRSVVCPTMVDAQGASQYRGSEVGLNTGRIKGLGPVRRSPNGGAALGPSRLDEPRQLWLSGACMAFHRELFLELGGFDERFFMYWEDVDFSFRAVRAGAKLAVQPDLAVMHDEGGTQRRRGRAKSNLYYFWNARNRLLFAAYNLPRRSVLCWLTTTPSITREIWLQGGGRQLFSSPLGLPAVIAGSVVGAVRAAAIVAIPWRYAQRERVRLPTAVKSGSETLRVTVAMLTFHRPADLRAVLPMLVAQAAEVSDEAIEANVLIVDNDTEGSARSIVAAFADPRVTYVIEETPGISAGRNRALEEASDSDVLVFIDDDERPQPGWLRNLLATYRATAAAAVAGAVVPGFSGPVDPWIASGRLFDRRRLVTGTRIHTAATNNLLLDLHAVRSVGLRFDHRFGLSGAEDTMFTRMLCRLGALMVWCDEAVVTDVIPAERMRRSWLLCRAFSSGNSWGIAGLGLADARAERWCAAGFGSLKGAIRVVGGAVRFIVGLLVRSPRHQARGSRTFGRGLGMIVGSMNIAYQEYGRAEGRRRRWSVLRVEEAARTEPCRN